MIRGLLSSALRAATALKLTPKKYFVFFWGPRGGRQGWDRTPKRFAKQKDLREFSGFPKIFFAEKDFWEKEEQALKTWCLPSGKYPKRAPLNGVPAKIFAKQKDLWGKERRALKAWRLTLVNCSPNAPRGIFRAPAKIFAKQKDLWGKEEPTLSAWHSPSGGCPQKASCSDVVPPTGLEPIRLPAQDPKSCASANFATAAYTPPLAGRRAIFLS